MYRDNRKTEIKVGIISCVGMMILFAIIMFAKSVNITSDTTSVIFEFANSGGINIGAPVVVNGVKRGNVTDVWADNEKVLIKADLLKVDDLKDDLTAIISILEITGGKKIEITPGKSLNKFNPESTIKGVATSDLSSIITQVSGLSNNLSSIIIKLDSVVTNVNSLLADKNMTHDLRNIVANTAEITGNLADVVNSNKILINSTMTNIAAITNELKVAINENKPQIEQIIDNLSVTTNDLSRLMSNTNNAINGADKLISDLNIIVSDIKQNNGGALSKLLYDKAFAQKLDSLLISVDSLATQINTHGINVNVRLGTRP